MNALNLYTRISDKRTYLEIWGASTKHPDVIRCLEDDIESGKFNFNQFTDEVGNVFQWLLHVASDMTFTFSSYEIADYAITAFSNYRDNSRTGGIL